MNNLPENVTPTEEVVEEKAAETEVVAETETAAKTESAEQLFVYDEKYARKKKTYAVPVHRYMAVWGALIVAFLVAFVPMLLLPSDSILSMIAFYAGILIALFGIFVVPSFFKDKIKAWPKSFLTEEDKIWAAEFTPIYYGGMQARGGKSLERLYFEECYKACCNKAYIEELVEQAKQGKNVAKGQAFKSVKTFMMREVKIVKAGKIAKVSYVDARGKKKLVKLVDCYPGLFEHISK